jgi:hypothetical protein
MGITPAGVIDIRWAPADSVSDLVGWQTALLKLQSGVPLAQVLLETGYTVDQVDDWLPENEGQVAFHIDTIKKIAQAMQPLSMAVTAGALTAEQFSAVFANLVTQAAQDQAA